MNDYRQLHRYYYHYSLRRAPSLILSMGVYCINEIDHVWGDCPLALRHNHSTTDTDTDTDEYYSSNEPYTYNSLYTYNL